MRTIQVKTLANFVRFAGLRMTAERWHENPHMTDGANMDHWKCVLRAGRSRLTVYFSMGFGHGGKAPKVGEVLDCLASDASSVEQAQSFEDWARELGYGEDSRTAERLFRTCEREAKRLRRFLGDSAYETLLYHTERG